MKGFMPLIEMLFDPDIIDIIKENIAFKDRTASLSKAFTPEQIECLEQFAMETAIGAVQQSFILCQSILEAEEEEDDETN